MYPPALGGKRQVRDPRPLPPVGPGCPLPAPTTFTRLRTNPINTGLSATDRCRSYTPCVCAQVRACVWLCCVVESNTG